VPGQLSHQKAIIAVGASEHGQRAENDCRALDSEARITATGYQQ
jgi:hypothetical protein